MQQIKLRQVSKLKGDTMRRVRVCVALLFTSVVVIAQQPVLKLKPGFGGSQNCVARLALNGGFQMSDSACEVTVLNEQDTRKIIGDAQQVAEQAAQTTVNALDQRLETEISALNQQVKTLSDANDALTKRVDDLEKKNKGVNKPSSLVSPYARGSRHTEARIRRRMRVRMPIRKLAS